MSAASAHERASAISRGLPHDVGSAAFRLRESASFKHRKDPRVIAAREILDGEQVVVKCACGWDHNGTLAEGRAAHAEHRVEAHGWKPSKKPPAKRGKFVKDRELYA